MRDQWIRSFDYQCMWRVKIKNADQGVDVQYSIIEQHTISYIITLPRKQSLNPASFRNLYRANRANQDP